MNFLLGLGASWVTWLHESGKGSFDWRRKGARKRRAAPVKLVTN